jgi:hypothetical protein
MLAHNQKFVAEPIRGHQITQRILVNPHDLVLQITFKGKKEIDLF